MPTKRTRRPLRRDLVSLAATSIPPSSSDQLQHPMPTIEPLLIEYDAITLATTTLNTTQQLEEDVREYEYNSPSLFDQAEVQPERDLQVRESSFERSPSRNLLHPLELRRQVEPTIHLV